MKKKLVIIMILLLIFLQCKDTIAETNQYDEAITLIKVIEENLRKEGTSIPKELEKLSKHFKNKALTYEYHDKALSIVNSIDDILFDIDSSNKGINLKGVRHPIYSQAVGAVISWFSSQGYFLSAELLIHARDNNDPNSSYYPVEGSRVTTSDVFAKIKKSTEYKGKDEFPNQGSKYERDLYYSIHGFRWIKNYYNDVTIIDYYDYEFDKYEGLQGYAVGAMAMAERLGVIVPYHVYITK